MDVYQKGLVATVKELVVDSNHQRKGIGKRLLVAFEEDCSGAFLLKLGTNEDSDAVKFYRTLGYDSERSFSMFKFLRKP